MEFWKIYRIVKSRLWMILFLLVITLVTVAIAKKAVDEQTQYVTGALVLPSYEAMRTGGLYADSTKTSVLTPTYDRFSRMAQFLQEIKSRFPDAVQLASQPAVVQKRALVQALSSRLPPAAAKTALAPNATEHTLDIVLGKAHVPTEDAIWTPRTFTDASQQQMRDGLVAAPFIDTSINSTPGANTATPVTTDDLQIAMHASDPAVATQLTNLIAAAFINGYKEEGIDEYSSNISTTTDQLKTDTNQLTKAENELTAFRERQPYVNLPTASSLAVNNLAGLERGRNQAELQMQVAQKSAATLEQLAEARGPSNVVSLDPRSRPHYQQLQEEIADATAALNALGTDLTPDNPRYQKAKAVLQTRIQERDDFLKQPFISVTSNPEYPALKAQADAARAEAARAQQTVASLSSQITVQRAQNEGLPKLENQLYQLSTQVRAAEVAVDADNANVRSLRVSNALLNRGLITMETPASYATPDTSGPSLASLLIYGAILSLIIGIAAAVGLDYLDNSVQTIPDAEKLLGMPVSAVIPAMPPGDPRHNTRLTVSDPLSPIAESYRLLRTDLLFTAEEKPFKSLMAATAKPGQGATTTICNLAVALATVGKRVILIDADLRRPKLHGFFNVSNETGLTSLLNDECELEEALKVTDIDNLLVLPSGPLPLNPAELLASQKMRALHERLKPHTDFVLVDTPSAIAFSDSSILASYLDAVMIVVRAQETPRGSEMQLKNLLNKARANVVGVVLNGVKPQLVDSYYYHAAYYPQVSPSNGHALGVSPGGGVLPPPVNGSNGRPGGHKTHERTLEGEDVGAVVAGRPSADPQQNIEATTIMSSTEGEDIVTVTPPKPRSRFSLRRRPSDDQD